MTTPRITAETGPTGITVITAPEGMAFVTVELDGRHPPAEPGQDAPDGPEIVDSLMKSGIVAAAFCCPHGAVAIIRVDPPPAGQDEQDCAQASARDALEVFFRHGGHQGLATPTRENRSCTRRYYAENLTENHTENQNGERKD